MVDYVLAGFGEGRGRKALQVTNLGIGESEGQIETTRVR